MRYVVPTEGFGVGNDSETVTLTKTRGVARECMQPQQ